MNSKSRTFYAKFDPSYGINEASNRPFQRFLGVTPSAFRVAEFNQKEGCDVYVIEAAINQPLFSALGFYPSDSLREEEYGLNEGETSLNLGKYLWFKIEVEFISSGNSRIFRAFQFEPGEFASINIKKITRTQGPSIKSVRNAAPKNPLPNLDFKTKPSLNAFYVGQGMCSLLTSANSEYGLLFDAGAGTPIHRNDYLKSNVSTNELFALTSNLTQLDLVLSHNDYDHWSLLAWGGDFLKKIKTILVPDQSNSLAFRAKTIIPCVFGIRAHTNFISSNNKVKVDIFRSKPLRNRNSNTNCLITRIEINKKIALLPGDCTYHAMLMNSNDPAIRLLVHPNAKYDAVVVPHHGCLKSSFDVPLAANNAIAFFSAGDHDAYQHPKQDSLDTHLFKNYTNIEFRNLSNTTHNLVINIPAHKLL